MKKILTLILVMMAIALPSFAEGSKSDNSHSVALEFESISDGTSTVHRAPMRINIDAYYNAESNTINISYDGEAKGEVFLYLNGVLVGYESEINASFSINTPGRYTIEIIGETWIAKGSIKLP